MDLPIERKDQLRKIITENNNVFCTAFSSGPLANVEPLRIQLTKTDKLVCTRMRKKFLKQRAFFVPFVAQLVAVGMAYFNVISTAACAPLQKLNRDLPCFVLLSISER